MADRKLLDEACDGGVFCPVAGHATATRRGQSVRVSHIKLTAGQQKTLWERRLSAPVAMGETK